MDCNVIENILTSLNSGKVFLKCPFQKAFSKHNKGDFRCFFEMKDDNEKVQNLCSEIVEKCLHWARGFVKLEFMADGLGLFLYRTYIYSNFLKQIIFHGASYGINDLYVNKIIFIEKETMDKDLSDLRISYVADVLSKCLSLCGISLESKCSKEENIEKNDDIADRLSIKISSKTFHKQDYFVIVGSVLGPNRKSSTLNLNDYFSFRREEVKSMCERKSDENLSECENNQEDLEKSLFETIISFDLMHTTVSRSVAISLEPETKGRSKGAVFVLYNYVRLVAICDKFESLVASGLFPPVPDFDNIDFSLLTDENEWKLMFDYILVWPQLIKNSIADLKVGKPKLHLVWSFLISLASDFSHYYRKSRILMEPRNHLIPLVFARICLLRVLEVIFKNALSLLSISPPRRM